MSDCGAQQFSTVATREPPHKCDGGTYVYPNCSPGAGGRLLRRRRPSLPAQVESLLEQRESAGLLERQRTRAQLHSLRTQLEQSQHRCRGLRCSLLAYVHRVVAHVRAGGQWVFPEDDAGEAGDAMEDYGQALAFPAGTARVMLAVLCLHQARHPRPLPCPLPQTSSIATSTAKYG